MMRALRDLGRALALGLVLSGTASALPITVSFRDGVGGYAGTKDTYVHEDATGTNQGANVKVYADGDDDLGTAETNAQVVAGLLRFDNMFACAAGPSRCGGPIPDLGAGQISIISAILTVRTGTASGDISAATRFDLHRMIATWDESSTWSSLTSGISYNGTEAASTATAAVLNPGANTAGGLVNFDVTADLQTWADNTSLSTRGWAIKPCSNSGAAPVTGCTDGWLFDSSEAATVADRPLLTVTYEVIPEPTTALLLGLGLLGLARAGSRRSG